MVSDIGLAPTRRQAIILTMMVSLLMHISLGLNELRLSQLIWFIIIKLFLSSLILPQLYFCSNVLHQVILPHSNILYIKTMQSYTHQQSIQIMFDDDIHIHCFILLNIMELWTKTKLVKPCRRFSCLTRHALPQHRRIMHLKLEFLLVYKSYQ